MKGRNRNNQNLDFLSIPLKLFYNKIKKQFYRIHNSQPIFYVGFENRVEERTHELNRLNHDNMESFNSERDSYAPYTVDTKVLSGMFRDRESSEWAYGTLVDKGYSKDDINVVMSAKTRERDYSILSKDNEIGNGVSDYADRSAIVSTNGADEGVVHAICTGVAIPVLGILIAGPLASDLAGGVGGIAGGLVGALVGSGMPMSRAKLYESGIKEGNTVLYLTPKDEADGIYLQTNWKKNHGEEIHY